MSRPTSDIASSGNVWQACQSVNLLFYPNMCVLWALGALSLLIHSGLIRGRSSTLVMSIGRCPPFFDLSGLSVSHSLIQLPCVIPFLGFASTFDNSGCHNLVMVH